MFVTEIVALKVLHKIGGIVFVKPKKYEKIAYFPILTEIFHIKIFLGVISFIRKYIKNFAEISCFLFVLIGNTKFYWDLKQQTIFQIFKKKYNSIVEIYSWDFLEFIRLYSDANIYRAKYAII